MTSIDSPQYGYETIELYQLCRFISDWQYISYDIVTLNIGPFRLSKFFCQIS